MSETPMTPEQRAAVAAQLGAAQPATDALLAHIARSVREAREHDHTTQREDLFCMNLTSWMGERMAAVLRRLVEAEAAVARLRAELEARPTRDAVLREAAEIADEAVPDEPHTDWDRGRLSAARDIRSMLGVTPIVTEHASVPRTKREHWEDTRDGEHRVVADASETPECIDDCPGCEPTPLRWGLDDTEYGDDDSVTVLLFGPRGEPYVLELDADRAAALRDNLSGPDDEGLSGPCDCGEGAVHYTADSCPVERRAAERGEGR